MPLKEDRPASPHSDDRSPPRRFPAAIAHDRGGVGAGLQLLRATVTAGMFLFVAAILLQHTAFDVGPASRAEARANEPTWPAPTGDQISFSPPIGPALGVLLAAVTAVAIYRCRGGLEGAGSSGAFGAIAVVTLGFLGVTLYRLTGRQPGSGAVETGLCAVVWFATAVIATNSLARIAREIGSVATSSKLREHSEYGILVVLIALLAAAVLGGTQAIASATDLTISFQKTPVLAFVRTVAFELQIGLIIGAIAWLVTFRRIVQDLVFLVAETRRRPDGERPPGS